MLGRALALRLGNQSTLDVIEPSDGMYGDPSLPNAICSVSA
jgi:hypothetical protein